MQGLPKSGGEDRDKKKRYSPQEAAVEDIFYAKNARAALVLGHARGAALLSIANAGLDVHEYTPLEIKKALVGYGGAGKDQVKMMVKSLLHLKGDCEDHSSDALAVAICHIHSSNYLKKIEADYETCDCTHSHDCHEQKYPVCCGKPMLEIMDD
jgi:Holliday junction resolvasome RuvABC endonuclease subunit